MSDRDEHDEDGAPMELFWLGNFDEGNKVEADYLDEDARQHLAGLTKIDLGPRLVDLAEGEQFQGKDVDERIEQAADALDFADEDELIEDASAPPPAAPSYAAVGAALATGTAAEEEDYDFDEDAPQATQPPPAAAATITFAPKPSIQATVPAPPLPVSQPSAPRAVDAAGQTEFAKSRGIQLPVLSQDNLGQAVLAFTDLFRSISRPVSRSERRIELHPPERRHKVTFKEGDEVDEGISLLTARLEDLATLGVEAVPRGPEEPAERPLDHLEHPFPFPTAPREPPPGEEASKQPGEAPEGPSAVLAGGFAEERNLSLEPSALQPALGSTHLQRGPQFPVLPACVFDPVIQSNWETRILGYDNGCDDTSSEHETDDEEVQFAVQGAENGPEGVIGMEVELGEAGAQGEGAGAGGEEEEVVGEGGEEGSAPTAAAKAAAEAQAAREYISVWEGAEEHAQHPVGGAPDPEDVVKVLASAPLLRYADPLQRLFPVAAPAMPAAAAPSAAPAAEEGAEQGGAGTSAAAAAAAAPAVPAAAGDTDAVPAAPEEEDIGIDLPLRAAARAPQWEADVVLEGGAAAAARLKSLPLTFDLNDPSLILQDIARKAERDDGFKSLVSNATATVVPYQKKVTLTAAKGVEPTDDDAVLELARLNISRDADYFAQPKRRTGTGGVRPVHHSKLASTLMTIPLKLDATELNLWHRPRGLWWPVMPPGRRSEFTENKRCNVQFKFLTGTARAVKGFVLHVTVEEMFNYAYETKNRAAKVPLPTFVLPGKPPTEVPPGIEVGRTGAPQRRDTLEITAVYRKVELQPTEEAEAVPNESNSALLRPPMAFKLRKELHAETPGRVLLVEYLQDAPLLLNRPGMGARLATYYRRAGPGDNGYQRIRNEAVESGQRWKVGAMNPIGEDDESPFLGDLTPGIAQLSIETGLFTAPAAAHLPAHSDFLLTRTPGGAGVAVPGGIMQAREITGSVVCGQQLPLHRIPVPGSRDIKDLEERCIYAHVFRDLSDRQRRAEEKAKKTGEEVPVQTVSLNELHFMFKRPLTALRIFLKDGCGLVALKNNRGDELFVLKEGVRMPSEAELRRKFTPEDACVLEACYVAEHRMMLAGLAKPEKFNYGNVAADKLRLAAEMLPQDAATQAAAKAVETQYTTAAWNLTDAFMASFREGRATMRLLGPGDPTGRGVGYSFVRDIRHKGTGSDDPTKALAKQRTGKVQGTDADLRRMTTEQAKRKLMDFGLDEAEIDPLGRWVRIDLVRQLANATAADGGGAGIAKYVRHQKTTLIELQKRYRERAQQIFQRQVAVLNNSAAEELGDQAALEAELEAELAAEEQEDEVEPVGGRKKADKKGGRRDSSPAPEEEARQLEEMRAAGLLGSPEAGSAAGGAGPSKASAAAASQAEAAAAGISGPLIPGQTRRIRREVLRRGADGTWGKVHEVIYAGRDRPFMLASLYQKEGAVVTGPWGFGNRTITAVKVQQRLSYAAARGRGMSRGGRGGRRGGGAAGGGGRRGGGRGRGRGGRRGLYDDLDDEIGEGLIMNRSRSSKRTVELRFRPAEVAGYDEDEDDFLEEISDDEEFDAAAEELREQGFVVEAPKKSKKPPAAPRAPKAPKAPKPPAAEGEDGEPPKPKKPKPKPKPKPPKSEAPPPGEDFIYDFSSDEEEKAAKAAAHVHAEPAAVVPRGQRQQQRALRDVAPVEWAPDFLGGAAVAPPATVVLPVALDREDKEDYMPSDEDDDQDYWEGEEGGKRRKTRRGGGGGAPRPQLQPQPRRQGAVDTSEEEDAVSDVSDSPGRKKRSKNAPPKKVAAAKIIVPLGGGPKALGKIFVAIIEQMKAEGEDFLKTLVKGTLETTYFRLFGDKVPSGVKDYSRWVPPHRALWLKEVIRRANYGYYESADAFMADIEQIRENCEIYNDPETGGPHRTPSYIEYAKGMVDYIKGKLQAHAKDIDRALGKVAAPPAAKRFKPYAPPPQAPAVDVVDFDPSANYLATAPSRPAQGKKGGATQKQRAVGQGSPAVANAGPNFPIIWAMCEKCRAWRTVDLEPSKSIIWECSMKPGFTCATPLEPGASYESI